MGRIGRILSHRSRGETVLAAQARPVPRTRAIASDPSASSTVRQITCQIPGSLNASWYARAPCENARACSRISGRRTRYASKPMKTSRPRRGARLATRTGLRLRAVATSTAGAETSDTGDARGGAPDGGRRGDAYAVLVEERRVSGPEVRGDLLACVE